MDFTKHEYTHAIVGSVACEQRPTTGRSNFNDARTQRDFFLRVLGELNIDVIEVEIEGNSQAGGVLEDLAIVSHGTALLPNQLGSGWGSKTSKIKDILKNDLGQTIITVTDQDTKLMGSDVLFTGHEFFVGISETTNEAGASAVAEAFPEFPCTPIKVPKGAHQMKKYITIAGPDILCVGASKEAKELLKRIEREATFSYQTLTVPEDDAANCLYVNGTLIHRAIEEIPNSFKIFCEKIDFARRSICFSELAKIWGGLSGSCLLVRKSEI